MTKFADELFDDLMQQHGADLATVARPARRTVPRPVWLAAGVVGMAGAVTAGVAIAGGGTPAYAVTANNDGTVTISLNQLNAVNDANGALHKLGDPVVIVPVHAGCVSIDSLPVGLPLKGQHTSVFTQTQGHSSGKGGVEGIIRVQVHGVPAGDTVLVAAKQSGNAIEMATRLITGTPPRCVTLPATMSPPPTGASSGGHEVHAPGGGGGNTATATSGSDGSSSGNGSSSSSGSSTGSDGSSGNGGSDGSTVGGTGSGGSSGGSTAPAPTR